MAMLKQNKRKDSIRGASERNSHVVPTQRQCGALSLSAAEEQMLCSTFQEHKPREGTARSVDMWLCLCCPVLWQCQQLGKTCKTAEDSDDSSDSFSSVSIGSSSVSVDGINGDSVGEDEERGCVG